MNFMNEESVLIIENYKPEVSNDFHAFFKEHKELLGAEFLQCNYKLNLLKTEASRVSSPHVAIQVIKEFLATFSTEDPLWIHFDIAKRILAKENIADTLAIDSLVRRFLDKCRELSSLIQYPFSLTQALQECRLESDKGENSIRNPALEILEFTGGSVDESEYNCHGLFLWDAAYLSMLSNLGRTGLESSQIISNKLKSNFQHYHATGEVKALLDFWFVEVDKENGIHFFHSPAFLILCETVWNDITKKQWDLQRHSCPSVARAIWISTIKPPLRGDPKIIIKETSLTCYSEEGRVIANVPCVDPKFISLIKKGMEEFSSLTGHKLLRWQVKTGFLNWLERREDPRLVCTTGGYKGIVHLIGCDGDTNPKTIGQVKAILHAQAFGCFPFPDGSQGNMIALREIEKHRNGEPSKINIVLGDLILPNYPHFLPKGSARRLIPITELPPLVGTKNTHAAQAMLQLLILEEFSNQSNVLVEKGSIYLPMSKLEELASEAKLPKSRLEVVLSAWTEDNSENPAFLQKQGDDYTLGKAYSQVTNFLEYQGKKRNEGAKAGKKAAESKKKFAKSGYSQKKRSQE